MGVACLTIWMIGACVHYMRRQCPCLLRPVPLCPQLRTQPPSPLAKKFLALTLMSQTHLTTASSSNFQLMFD
ncbi:hypothetical protein BJV77DRAFT_1036841, partial [Russula vinacea]